MRFRKLRIGWSVGWGFAYVLLVALYVRSYWRIDKIVWTGEAGTFAVTTDHGKLTTEIMNERVMLPLGWCRGSFSVSDDDLISDDEPRTQLGFGLQTENGSITAHVPFW